MEAYQLTDQCVSLARNNSFAQSNTDPRVAKTAKDCCFVIEKKEQRKVAFPAMNTHRAESPQIFALIPMLPYGTIAPRHSQSVDPF